MYDVPVMGAGEGPYGLHCGHVFILQEGVEPCNK